jgi:hypothetical protein
VQADAHKTRATNTTRIMCFHHLGKLFLIGHIPASSGYALPSPLVAFEAVTPEEPSLSQFIPASARPRMRTAAS